MADQEPPRRKRQKKKYLAPNEPFIVPPSTVHYRNALESVPPANDERQDGANQNACCSDDATATAVSAATADAPEAAVPRSPHELDEALESEDDSYSTDQVCSEIDELLDSLSDNAPDGSSRPAAADSLKGCLEQFEHETLPGSSTRTSEAMAMIMTFISTNGLSWSALDDLVRIINALFGKNVLPGTKYLFRKLWAHKLQRATHHYYCEFCEGPLTRPQEGSEQIACETCQRLFPLTTLKSKGNFFTILDLNEQVGHIIQKYSEALFCNLQKINRHQNSRDITDITDANIYRQLKRTGALQWGDLTITFSTDGSPVFKSSKASVWPLQFIINEVPAPDRFSSTCVAGLWFGHKHPNMLLFLEKFVEALQEMQPVSWKHHSNSVLSKVYAISCCVDAPARAAVQNQVLFNGYLGCPWCLVVGEHIAGENLGVLCSFRNLWCCGLVYLLTEHILSGSLRFLDAKPAERRTPEMVLRDMKYAIKYDTTVNGFKGPSPLVNLTNYDLVSGQAAEYMHSVLQGVAKQLTDHLLDSSNSEEAFYIGEYMQKKIYIIISTTPVLPSLILINAPFPSASRT